MAIWKDPTPAKAEPARFDAPPPGELPVTMPTANAATPTPIRAVDSPARESVIAADLTIEGKIEGAGHVRIAGKFKGDVKVQGNLTIEQGGVINGDLKAGSLTVAAGSRIRGHIECGWDKDGKSAAKTESGSAA